MKDDDVSSLKPWQTHLWEHECDSKKDLKLLPGILRKPDENHLLKTRLQWLIDILKLTPDEIFTIWSDPVDHFLQERMAFKGHLADFHIVSKTLSVLLFKEEVKNWKYFKSLYLCLKVLPCRTKLPLFVVGPTAGGEIEIADAAGADAYLIGPENAIWTAIAEERLFHTSTTFESVARGVRPKGRPFALVLSPWCPDPAKAVRVGYDALESFGFILFPSSIISMVKESERLGLTRKFTKLDGLAVYYKAIDLPYQIGAEEKDV